MAACFWQARELMAELIADEGVQGGEIVEE